MGKSRILVQKADLKSGQWAAALEKLQRSDTEICPMSGSPLLMPSWLLWSIFTAKPVAVCFRYLNDYPSLLKSLVRLLTDLSTVYIALLFRVRILWISHNVGKQTEEYFPRLVHVRVRAVIRHAKHIFVTDPLLVGLAARAYNIETERFATICFGAPPIDRGRGEKDQMAFIHEALQWRRRILRKDESAHFAIWIGSFAEKTCSGIRAMRGLHAISKRVGTPVYFIVVGPTIEQLNNELGPPYQGQKAAPFVFSSNGPLSLSPHLWAEIAEFVWRPLSDLSVPYTAYCAAEARLPYFCEPKTFLAEFLTVHGLGGGLEQSEDGVRRALTLARQWAPKYADEFLNAHSWCNGARALIRAL